MFAVRQLFVQSVLSSSLSLYIHNFPDDFPLYPHNDPLQLRLSMKIKMEFRDLLKSLLKPLIDSFDLLRVVPTRQSYDNNE